jgi:hypothetical protein
MSTSNIVELVETAGTVSLMALLLQLGYVLLS